MTLSKVLLDRNKWLLDDTDEGDSTETEVVEIPGKGSFSQAMGFARPTRPQAKQTNEGPPLWEALKGMGRKHRLDKDKMSISQANNFSCRNPSRTQERPVGPRC